jgi:hypothetical protein
MGDTWVETAARTQKNPFRLNEMQEAKGIFSVTNMVLSA